MALHPIPKAIFNGSVRLARAPFDLALRAVGGSDSSAGQALDRVEARARRATGIVFADAELKAEGSAAMAATEKRERAERLHEEAESREEQAVRSAAARKRRASKTAAKARRDNAKREKAARLKTLEAKEDSVEAQEAAAATEREADRLRKAAASAKRKRKEDRAS